MTTADIALNGDISAELSEGARKVFDDPQLLGNKLEVFLGVKKPGETESDSPDLPDTQAGGESAATGETNEAGRKPGFWERKTKEAVMQGMQSCSLFFAMGGRQRLAAGVSWNWRAFLFPVWFLVCRKCYGFALVAVLLGLPLEFLMGAPFKAGYVTLLSVLMLLFMNPVASVLCGMYGDYIVARRFAVFLNRGSDAFLYAAGRNTKAEKVCAVLVPFGILVIILANVGAWASMIHWMYSGSSAGIDSKTLFPF